MNRNYPHLLGQIFNRAHMMTPELMALAVEFSRAQLTALDLIASIQPQVVIQSYEQDDDNDDDEDQAGEGLTVIPIAGPLVPRTGNLKLCQQMTAYEQVATQVDAALNDPDCAQIVFDIDSPGGASTGAFELASKIRAAGQIKPTTAIVNFNAMSGAYLLAAACNEISLSQSGGVGSIGVIAQHMDVSKMNEAMGLKITAVYRGDKKNNLSPNEPLNDASMAELSGTVDRTYQQFVDAVSGYRSLTKNQVIDTQAGLYFGQDAIDAGLADRLETPQDAINRIAADVAGTRMASMQTSRQLQLHRQAIAVRARTMALAVML
ncbi:S49 family peptidase [Pandoraea soli]